MEPSFAWEENAMQDAEVHGPYMVEELVCQNSHMLNSQGIFVGSNPLKYSTPLLFLQVFAIVFTTRLLFRLLKPFKQGMISCQVLAGIILGPSLLGQNQTYSRFFLPAASKVTLQTLSYVGFIIHLFLLGLKIDPTILRKAGSKAILIGTASYGLPFSLGNLTHLYFKHLYNLPVDVTVCLTIVVALNSMTSFPVTTTVLADLNILNSELGRLATNCSIVCEACTWIVAIVFKLYLHDRTLKSLWGILWIITLGLTITFVFRPLIIWLTERTTKKFDKKDEIPFFSILVVLFLTSLGAEVFGVHAAFGAFWLGVVLPDGPPLGTALAMKLDSFATSLLLPCFIAISGLQSDFFEVRQQYSNIIELIIVITYGCKFLGTMVASTYCNIQFGDTLCLAFLMCCQGIVEVYACIMWKDAKFLNTECYNLIILTLLLVTGVSRFLVVKLYDPSKRYKTKSKRTILNTRQQNLQLRLLACIYNVENVPPMVNLLEASNPTRFNPISVFTLHLIELIGRAHAVLVPHHEMNKLDPNAAQSTQIVNAFQRFEQQHQGSVMAQHFTAVAPYSSINDDVCTLALDKKATLIILPFHKQYGIDGSIGSVNPVIRNINQNVLDKGPCSVGILIDRGETSSGGTFLMSRACYNVGLLFLGGPDDMEALALCLRMAEHAQVNVTVVQFKHKTSLSDIENRLINDFKSYTTMNKGKLKYREEIVRDGVEITRIISSIGDTFDMVIVGRQHEVDPSLLFGLTAWSECPELGAVGDMLSSPDFHCSVLVIHQQSGESLPEDDSFILPVVRHKTVESRVHPRFSIEEGFTTIDLGKD